MERSMMFRTSLVAIAVLVMTLLPSARAFASWQANGNPICTAGIPMSHPAILSDGAGGAILSWDDKRNGNVDIFAQRVNASGSVLWTTTGVEICTATGDQTVSMIASDGAGGAIFTWLDGRNGNTGIYAQRVDISGSVQWETDGVALCTATGSYVGPVIASDGAGGAIVAWVDFRSGSGAFKVYAQRVSASGAVLWTIDGVAMSTETAVATRPTITSDAAGGAIVAWTDYRGGNNNVYAQRVNPSGTVQWTANGVPLCPATTGQLCSGIIPDGAGGAIVAWEDSRNVDWDVYVQRVSASGSLLWTTSGVVVCAAIEGQWQSVIASDGEGGAIVTWEDSRSGNDDIYVQRVNASGAALWAADGIALCTATNQQLAPTIIFDGAGGAIVTWGDMRNGSNSDVYAQHVNVSGALLWAANGVAVCTAPLSQRYPVITTDGAGGAIAAWLDKRGGGDGIYAQRLYPGSCGTPSWLENGNAVSTAPYGQRYPQLAPDGSGGAIMAWQDNRTTADWDIFAQRVDASGCMLWELNGSAICTSLHDQANLQMIPDEDGGAIIAWEDYRSGTKYDIYAQRVNPSGYMEWTLEGIPVCAAGGSRFPRIVSDGAGGAIIAWEDLQPTTGYDIHAQRVNASGVVQWAANGVAACSATGDQGYIRMIPDGAGGAIITWQDHRSGTYNDIYAQRVDASGAVRWTADGVPVCTAAWAQNNPRIASDGYGGAIIAWQDRRRAPADWDIYAQRVNASGNVMWQADGVVVCDAAHDQSNLQMISDDCGGAVLTWEDYRNGTDYDIVVQRMNGWGQLLWDIEPICSAPYGQRYPQIASGEAGRSITVWQDNRTTADWDLYSQQVGIMGNVAWPGDSTIVCAAAHDQTYQQLVPDGEGGAIVVWEDYRNGTDYDICVGHIEYEKTTDVSDIGVTLSGLSQNYPNPFNPATLITFSVRTPGEVKLRIYDVAGRALRTLVDGWRGTGEYREMWDGKRDDGTAVASGVYFYRLETSGLTATRKMVLLK